jgi:hypothetical protein
MLFSHSGDTTVCGSTPPGKPDARSAACTTCPGELVAAEDISVAVAQCRSAGFTISAIPAAMPKGNLRTMLPLPYFTCAISKFIIICCNTKHTKQYNTSL